MGRLGGRKGAKEGAGIQWAMFPSLCRVVVGEEMVDKEGEEEGLVRAQRTGLHSLRNILTKGQTSNV